MKQERQYLIYVQIVRITPTLCKQPQGRRMLTFPWVCELTNRREAETLSTCMLQRFIESVQ